MYVLRNTYYVLKGKQTESDMLKIRKFRIDPFYWLKIVSLSLKDEFYFRWFEKSVIVKLIEIGKAVMFPLIFNHLN